MANETRPPASRTRHHRLARRSGWASPISVVVDGSFYLPALKRDAKAEYLAGHIPGRGVLRHRRHRRPFHRPAAHAAGRRRSSRKDVGALGIGNDDTIVVYDGAGLGGAPRVWWTFRIFGAENVLHPRRRPAEMEGRRPPGRSRRGQAHAAQVRGRAEHRQWSPASPTCRWRCSTSPPRWSTRGRPTASAAKRRSRARACAPGHMPGALNVPVTGLIEDGRLIAPEQIARAVRGRRRRSRQAGHHELRLGRHRGDAVVRARRHRQGAEGALRRLLDRMGRAADLPVEPK